MFVDLVFADLSDAPRLGEERWTSSFGWTAGGIANFAIASARLGVSTVIAGAVGGSDDSLGSLARTRLAAEGVTDATSPIGGWTLPVTASIGYDGDRALVTGGTPAPPLLDLLAAAPATEVACVHLDSSLGPWIRSSIGRGTRVFADVGWEDDWDRDLLDNLDGSFAFLPNDREAMAYTSTDDALDAARLLAERVPLSVVTGGGDGVIAVDSAASVEVHRPPVWIVPVDATGAGDVFGGALASACLTDWDLEERIDFAALVAAITVSRPGGGAAAPELSELVPWLDAHPDAAQAGRFDFLRDALRDGRPHPFAPPTSPTSPTSASPIPF
jgi:sugar/nucleoside kinase (ribokinase family)